MSNYLISTILGAIIYILPAYVSNATSCIFGGGSPLDKNLLFYDGRRIIGNGVTIRGTVAGIICGTITGFIEGYIFANPSILGGEYIYNLINNMPISLSLFNNTILDWTFLGFLLSIGAIFGDAFGSFIKRRLNIKQGNPAPILDQIGFLVFALILAYPFYPVDFKMILIMFIITPVIHFSSNVIAYILGFKKVWW